MTTRNNRADFERSTSGIYARQMEAALTIKLCRVQKRIRADVQRIELGNCTLYVVPFRRWAYRRQEQQAAAWQAEQAQA